MRLRGVGAIAALSTMLVVGCADTFVGPATADDRASIFADVWKNVDLHYSFLDYKRIDWDSLGARYQPLAMDASTDRDFAVVIGQMLAELKDVHVSLTPFGDGTSYRYLSRYDTTSAHYIAQATLDNYVLGARATPDNHIIYGTVSASVAYVRIADFSGDGWGADMDVVLTKLAGFRSIIVDIRGNAGGVRAVAIDVAGRFADRPRTFGYLRFRNGPSHGDFTDREAETVVPSGPQQFTGSVFLLTDRKVVSAAEEFVLAMRVSPNILTLGDTTAGASGGPVVRELANGWTYQLSEWMEYTASGTPYEGIGLPPDVAVIASTDDMRRSRDPVLERALVEARQP